MKNFLLCCLLFPLFLLGEPINCKVFFSPKDQLADRLVEFIEKEEKSIKIAIYSMSHLGIAKALVAAKSRGVVIEVLIDPYSVKSRSSIHRLIEAKIPLFVWDQGIRLAVGKQKGLMHDKFCIFGDHSVWTGSFNFTNQSHLHHQENALMIDSREIAQKYLSQFIQMKLYGSRPYQEYLARYPKKTRAKKIK